MVTLNGWLSKHINESHESPKAVLYFAHSETVLPFLALLGLNKDEYALTHSNFEEAMTRLATLFEIFLFCPKFQL